MSTSFHISRNGETRGPWTIEAIAQKLAEGEIQITDFAWDATKKDWVALFDFSAFKAHLGTKKPSAPPPAPKVDTLPSNHEGMHLRESTLAANKKSLDSVIVAVPSEIGTHVSQEDESVEWFVSRGQQRFGPFSYLGVVKALQDKSIFEFDHIWKADMESWVRIAEHEKFSAETIRSLLLALESKKTKTEVFAQRRHPRFQIENQVLVHDNSNVSPGKMFEGSEGGSGVVINNAKLIPGQLIHLHFGSMEGLQAFNALGEIVSKRFSPTIRNERTPVQYGVRFVKMEQAAEERVKKFFKARQAQRTTA